MASSAFIGIGSVLSVLVGSSYVPIAEITDLNGPSITKDTVEVTNFDSANRFREFIVGLKDGGEISFTMNFVKTAYDAIKTEWDKIVPSELKLTLTDSTVFTFEGIVTTSGIAVPLEDKVSSDVTIKITGEVTVSS